MTGVFIGGLLLLLCIGVAMLAFLISEFALLISIAYLFLFGVFQLGAKYHTQHVNPRVFAGSEGKLVCEGT